MSSSLTIPTLEKKKKMKSKKILSDLDLDGNNILNCPSLEFLGQKVPGYKERLNQLTTTEIFETDTLLDILCKIDKKYSSLLDPLPDREAMEIFDYLTLSGYIKRSEYEPAQRGSVVGIYVGRFNGVRYYIYAGEGHNYNVRYKFCKDSVFPFEVDALHMSTTRDEAITKFNGSESTSYLLESAINAEYLRDYLYVCNTVNNMTKTNGVNWFVPSMGELYSISQYKDTLVTIFTDLGLDTTILKEYVWSSTVINNGLFNKVWGQAFQSPNIYGVKEMDIASNLFIIPFLSI